MRFEYAQSIRMETMFAETDLDLGNRILSQMALKSGDHFETPRLVANFAEYQPTRMNPLTATNDQPHQGGGRDLEQSSDEIFSDELISRDKELRQLATS